MWLSCQNEIFLEPFVFPCKIFTIFSITVWPVSTNKVWLIISIMILTPSDGIWIQFHINHHNEGFQRNDEGSTVCRWAVWQLIYNSDFVRLKTEQRKKVG